MHVRKLQPAQHIHIRDAIRDIHNPGAMCREEAARTTNVRTMKPRKPAMELNWEGDGLRIR